MQTVQSPASSTPYAATTSASSGASAPVTGSVYSHYQIIRRNGAVVSFEPSKIAVALMKAFLAVHGTQGAASASVRETVDELTQNVVRALMRSRPGGGTFHIEDVQDHVELGLMRSGNHEVARAYVLYRERRAQERAQKSGQPEAGRGRTARHDGGQRVPLDIQALQALIESACDGLGKDVKPDPIVAETKRNLYDGVPMEEVYKASILAARTLIEKDPDYTYATARLLLHTIRKEMMGEEVPQSAMGERYADYFPGFIKRGRRGRTAQPELLNYDLRKLGAALKAERDLQFDYLGLQTLYDRYFLHVRKTRIEMPQAFFMRVAMGLALGEIDREARAIEFYEVLSSFDFMSSTPTLFNSGTLRSQLSSCYLTTVPDDLDGIYESIKENALLSKFAGGLGNDWTRVRALGAHIKGTNGESQGVVPFLKVVNDTAVAVNQGGKRKGAVCTYLETWHLDIEEFLELRKNTGDDRRRTHDMNTANWIPDLFMKRVMEKGEWSLFSPNDVPDLHDKFGSRLRKRLRGLRREGRARRDQALPQGARHRPVAQDALDAVRDRPPLDHLQGRLQRAQPAAARRRGAQLQPVHRDHAQHQRHRNRGLQPGFGQPAPHLKDGQLDHAKLQKTINTAMRMLDNVIDINYYAVKKARDSNLRHRPVGLGIMGFQDALYELRIPYASTAAVDFADRSMEAVCYYAYWASTELARERGRYSSYKGSLWDQGILPPDTLDLLAQRERGGYVDVDRSATLDWDALRQKIARDGMRNSNCVAIAPTATISNIIGVDASIEPCFGNLSVKSNLSGEFTVINSYLVKTSSAWACGTT
jgi:ribonucleoside-diphosphate reductase alpha chain